MTVMIRVVLLFEIVSSTYLAHKINAIYIRCRAIHVEMTGKAFFKVTTVILLISILYPS